MTATLLPADTVARVHILPEHAPHSFTVCLAIPPVEPAPQALLRPGAMGAMLTHDAGLSWPDHAGVQLAAATLQRGGVVLLGFRTMADALACHARAKGGAA